MSGAAGGQEFPGGCAAIEGTPVRVLVVEDSARLQASLSQGLREAGFAVDAVGDGKRALIHGRTTDYDVIVLDLMLPGMDGLSVLRELRRKQVRTCVLILTAKDS